MSHVKELLVKLVRFIPGYGFGKIDVWDRRKGKTYASRITDIEISEVYHGKVTLRLDSGFSLMLWLPNEKNLKEVKESMNDWAIIDDHGIITSGPEEETRAIWDRRHTSNELDNVQPERKGYLRLIEIHEVDK